MDPQATARQSTLPLAAGPLATLQGTWTEATAAAAPEVGGLDELLSQRLVALEETGRLDEPSLLAVAEDAAQLALEAGSAATARELSKRLRRAIYEFLLAEDAVVEAAKELPQQTPDTVTVRDGVMLIGVEEVEAVAAARNRAAESPTVADGGGADDAVSAEAMRTALESDDGEWSAATDEVELWAGAAAKAAEQIEDYGEPSSNAAEDGVHAVADVEQAAAVGDEPGDTAAGLDNDASDEISETVALVEELVETVQASDQVDPATLDAVEDALAEVESVLESEPPAALDPDAAMVPIEFRRDEPATASLEPVPAIEDTVPVADAAAMTDIWAVAQTAPVTAESPVDEATPAGAGSLEDDAPLDDDLVGVPSLPMPFELAGPVAPAPLMIEPEPAAIPMVPREEFHISDASLYLPRKQPEETPDASASPSQFVPTPLPSLTAPPQPAGPADMGSAPAEDSQALAGWHVRLSPRQQLLAERMAAKRREEAVRTALEAAAQAAAAGGHERRSRRRGEPEPLGSFEEVHAKLEEHLNRKRGAEVGALLQRAAQELGGRHVADLAMDAGDRCMSVGQTRAATNCFLAAWRADPIYEAPLWRLADVCLSDREVGLAVGYLERIATLMRARGDDDGALNVYRKIVTVAPERRDIRDTIRLAQTTGRLEP